MATANSTEFLAYSRSMKDEPVYVILGSQGSGTNLLAKILRRVFNFSVVQDRSLIFNAALPLIRQPTPAKVQKQFTQVYRALFPGPVRKRLLSKHYFNQAKHYLGVESQFDPGTIRSASDFADFFYTYHAFVNSGAHKAVKSDDIWEQIKDLSAVIPRVRLILLVRDPRDNALSITNKPWGPTDLYCAALYVRKRLRIYQDVVERNASNAIVVKYEDLLSRPTDFAEQFAAQFGLAKPENLQSRLAGLPIRNSNFNKWEALDRQRLAICEAVLAEELKTFGYVSASRGGVTPSLTQRLSYRSCDVGGRVPQRIRRSLKHWVSP